MSKRSLREDSPEIELVALKRTKTERAQLAREDYTVGWICAIPVELGAAKAFLDEIHEKPAHIPHDDNDYTLGKIGRHNVVIAVLPSGEYGTSSAAIAARDMQRSFPCINVRLMVGIGGGAPSPRHDIRLGDIVVSEPRAGHGGVFQYDFGKTIQNKSFHTTGFLDQPPRRLRTALNGLKSTYMNDGCSIESTIETLFGRAPRLREHYSRPHQSTDRLFLSNVRHPPGDERSCPEACGNSAAHVSNRRERTNGDRLVVHYGLIASANQVMKDAVMRDKLAMEKDVLCFEMEAAGLMNVFPCLVIRSICDYSDSHKNKEWQGYAAMAAAAFAKDLLSHLASSEPPAIDQSHTKATSSLSNSPIPVQKTSLSEELNLSLLESLRFDQIEARLKGIKRAHLQTCKWLLTKSDEYRDWLDPDKLSGHQGFLWMRGKPGAGKSTMMKFAFDNIRRMKKDWIVISFFFHARGVDLERSTTGMYRSLLVQLLERRPELQEAFSCLGFTDSNSGNTFVWDIERLKDLFEEVVRRIGQSSVAIFIDALDECDEASIRDMVDFFQRLGELAILNGVQFRVFFSSRHYPHITIAQGLDLVLERQEGHEEDIAAYTQKKLTIGQSNLAMKIRDEIREKAAGVFMWVVLVVEILNKEHDTGRAPRHLQSKLKALPDDLHSLFRDILLRDQHNRAELLLCLQWVLFAKQPLSPVQLYYGILSGTEPADLSQCDPEEIPKDTVEKSILNSSKGLVEITKSKTPGVQFIHESVRDFLLGDKGIETMWPQLKGNIHGQSHERLKLCCITYMQMQAVWLMTPTGPLSKAKDKEAAVLRQTTNENFPLLRYAVQNILHHAEGAQSGQVDQSEFLRLFPFRDWLVLLNLFEEADIRRHTQDASVLYLLAEHGFPNLIRVYYDDRDPSTAETCFAVETERYGLPLFAALATGSDATIQALLDACAAPSSPNSVLRSLCREYSEQSAERGRLGRNFKFLKSRGVISYLKELDDDILLAYYLAFQKHLTLNTLLGGFRTILCIAAEKGNEGLVRVLLRSREVDPNMWADTYRSRTALSYAAESGHLGVVQLFLECDRVEFDKKCTSPGKIQGDDRTPLSYAAEQGHENIVKMLLDSGKVNPDSAGDGLLPQRTPLSFAAGRGHDGVVKLLLATGKVDPDVRSISHPEGRSPLSFAAEEGHEETVRLLLDTARVDPDSRSKRMETPLFFAVDKGHTATVQVLLSTGRVNPDARARSSRTPLSLAAEQGHVGITQLLLNTGKVDYNSRISIGPGTWWTPITFAARQGHEDVVRLLLSTDCIDLNAGSPRQSPLFVAVRCGREQIVRIILDAGKGAALNEFDICGQTPLALAVAQRLTGIVTLLREHGADPRAGAREGLTPLDMAESPFAPDQTN